MRALFFFIIPLIVCSSAFAQNAVDYLQGTLILKLKSDYYSFDNIPSRKKTAVDNAFKSLGNIEINKKFPHHKTIETNTKQGHKLVDLSLIYEVKYSSAIDPAKAANVLLATGVFDYAEPKYLPKPLYSPNDPLSGSQYHLAIIKAFEGWDIHKGDTNMVVGITDTGVDIDHEDLQGSIKYNYLDPVDGVDNDGDGFTDNFRGWDLGENDNNPQSNVNHHGVHVAGLSSAHTDNSKGIAGSGFKCKMLPVKIADANGSLTMSYEGIVYAADHGCKVINCSWGGGGGGQFGQDIINYAVFNQDALVIAAAGNNGDDVAFYPASYENVLNVAATTELDTKWPQSSYGCTVDISAPGYNVSSTWDNNLYISSSGTSMASPVAAGCAAVVRSYFPSYTALQAGERLRVTTDFIDSVNAGFEYDLGSGRVNLFNALTQGATPSVRISQRNINDGNDNAFTGSDTLGITGTFTNYLTPTTNLVVTLRSMSPFVTVLDSVFNAGSIATLASANNIGDPFKIKILNTAPLNHPVKLMLLYNDGSYNAFECFIVTVNVDYINVMINDVWTSITSKGKIGYNQDNQQEGIGFIYNNNNLLYEAGLLVGANSTQVSDVVRGTMSQSDQDFASLLNVHRIIPSVVSDFDLEGLFNDDPAGTTKLDIDVKHQAFAWSTPADAKYVIVRYVIQNNGAAPLSNVYAGIFADWDINNSSQNKAAYDGSLNLGYVYDANTNALFAGIKVLNQTPLANNYAIDNVSGGGGGVDMSNGGFSSAEKYQALSTQRLTAGAGSLGNDVAHIVSTGPFNVAPGDTAVAAFALLAGENLNDIQASATSAQIRYDAAFPLTVTWIDAKDVLISPLYPNPASDIVRLEFYIPDSTDVRIELYSVTGQLVKNLSLGKLGMGEHSRSLQTGNLANGMYFLKLKASGKVLTQPLVISGK